MKGQLTEALEPEILEEADIIGRQMQLLRRRQGWCPRVVTENISERAEAACVMRPTEKLRI